MLFRNKQRIMTITHSVIASQKDRVFGIQPKVELVEPCRIGRGIMKLTPDQKADTIKTFQNYNSIPTFFIPASGSGSRMFQFLFDFLDNPTEENRGQVERFLNHLEDFAFYRRIDRSMRNQLTEGRIDLSDFVHYIVGTSGLGLGDLPKGLVPFHNYGYFILNPFQEHVLQAAKLSDGLAQVHFTINLKHRERIEASIDQVHEISGYAIETTFSEQDINSDSIAFNTDGSVFELNAGQPLTRPSGHGALLDNLNAVSADIVFIKNIDNVQCAAAANESLETFSLLGGLLLNLSRDLRSTLVEGVLDRAKLEEIVQLYQLVEEADYVLNRTDSELVNWINRPRRVCGMVRNEGQPGGGPFWVKDKSGNVTKQIVEKAQIESNGNQFSIMVKSSHFNPVMIACDMRDLEGQKHDLNDFRDEQAYFVVKKRFKGQDILFAEQPGLWNGGMADWTTVFVEIPTSTFTPVKTVLDLLGDAH